MSPTPLQESSILFPSHDPSTNTNIHQITKQLTRQNLGIHNRLASISSDASFVQKVSQHYADLPVLANERCGSWYIPPELKQGSAYFKSTDGHAGQWGFSLRRLNVQVLERVRAAGGCVIVDSTRRGKSMPDALSKTVPIWISVLNAAFGLEPRHSKDNDLGGDVADRTNVLRTPASIVSPSEHAQIAARLPEFVRDFASTSLASIKDVVSLEKPMEPLWVTPDTVEFPPLPENKHAVILVTASGRTSSSIGNEAYVQGAADDAESWARGLTAGLFWRHREDLLAASEEELPTMIEALLLAEKILDASSGRVPTLVKPTNTIWIADNAAAEHVGSEYDLVVCCGPEPSENLEAKLKSRYLQLKCSKTPKIGSRDLRTQLPRLIASSSLRGVSAESKILVTCPTGKDLAVGVALAVICLCIDGQGAVAPDSLATGDRAVTNKSEIKQRLSWIMVSMPDASPSRATLQSINDFILR